MPINFGPYEKSLKSAEQVTPDVKVDDDAVRKLALEVVKANFPDWVKSATNNVTVSGKQPSSPNAFGEYSPWTHSISISEKAKGRWSPALRDFTPTPEQEKKGLRPRTDINFSLEEVMKSANILLHEIVHSQGGGGWSGKNPIKLAEEAGITPEIEKKIHAKYSHDMTPFFSTNAKYIDWEEFIANGVTIQAMDQRNMIPETGRLREQKNTLADIIKEVPQVQNLLDAANRRDVPTLKESAPSFKSLVQEAITSFAGKK